MKNIIYRGEWPDPQQTTDEDGDPFRPHIAVTEEVNGYLVWLCTPYGYAKPDFFHRGADAIEHAVGIVLRNRKQEGDRHV